MPLAGSSHPHVSVAAQEGLYGMWDAKLGEVGGGWLSDPVRIICRMSSPFVSTSSSAALITQPTGERSFLRVW